MTGLSKIVKTISFLMVVLVITFGLYIISHGHLTPGGGFQGGAVIATAVALLLVAFGAKKFNRTLGKEALYATECFGLLAFIALAFLGLNAAFFSNFLANQGGLFGMAIPSGPNPGVMDSAGTIPLMDFAIGIVVASALSLVLMLMYFSREGVKND